MKTPKRTRNGGTFKQSDFEWIKRLQGLGVDKKGAQRATGWSEDTVGRVYRSASFEDYRRGTTTNRGSDKPAPAVEPHTVTNNVTTVNPQLPLSMDAADSVPVAESAPNGQLTDLLTLLTSIDRNLEILVERTAQTKRGWLR